VKQLVHGANMSDQRQPLTGQSRLVLVVLELRGGECRTRDARIWGTKGQQGLSVAGGSVGPTEGSSS